MVLLLFDCLQQWWDTVINFLQRQFTGVGWLSHISSCHKNLRTLHFWMDDSWYCCPSMMWFHSLIQSQWITCVFWAKWECGRFWNWAVQSGNSEAEIQFHMHHSQITPTFSCLLHDVPPSGNGSWKPLFSNSWCIYWSWQLVNWHLCFRQWGRKHNLPGFYWCFLILLL